MDEFVEHFRRVVTCVFTHVPFVILSPNMNRSAGEAFSRLAQQLNRARQQAGRGGGAGGGRGGNGKGAATGGSLLMALVLGGLAVNASIYNVDGGHRAILYSRLGGIQDKIYGEGTHFKVVHGVVREADRTDPLG